MCCARLKLGLCEDFGHIARLARLTVRRERLDYRHATDRDGCIEVRAWVEGGIGGPKGLQTTVRMLVRHCSAGYRDRGEIRSRFEEELRLPAVLDLDPIGYILAPRPPTS